MPETQNMSPLASWLPQTLGPGAGTLVNARELSRGAAPDLQAEAVLTIAERIAQRREPLARQILERVRAEAVDADGAPDDQLAPSSTRSSPRLARVRLARRADLGEMLWEAVVASAGVDRSAEREAAIQIASSLMRQVALHLTLAERYIVVVVRDAEMHGEVGQ
jgi:hypothetical protein